MPSYTERQRRTAGMALAFLRGHPLKYVPPSVRKMAESMTEDELREWASKPLRRRLRKTLLVLFKRDVSDEPRLPQGPHGGEWTRLKAGDPHPQGHTPSTPEQRAIASDRMGRPVPPTSWGLVVAKDPESKVQATWYDARGRKQYGYHPRAVEASKDHKFAALSQFSKALPNIRKGVAQDLGAKACCSREQVAAAVARIIDKTSMRVGSEDYAEENETYGASSLRKNHVKLQGNRITFHFRGKHGKEHEMNMVDPEVARVLTSLMKLPGDRLMQYAVGKEPPRPVTEDTVNHYLKKWGATAKQFRTYKASRIVRDYLVKAGPPKSLTEAKRNVREAIKRAAEVLGNTVAVCKSSYVMPKLINDYMGSVK